MFSNFFQLLPIPSDQLNGFYDPKLVLLSFVVATSASYIALDLAGRLRDVSNTPTSKILWLVGGAIAMGSGIWSMHFIGMLSFTIPGLTLRYDLLWTGFSLLVAILASGFALYLLQAPAIRLPHYIAGGVILGFAIASMHYTGMQAMLETLNIHYLPVLFLLSILIAILASEAALWLALKSNQVVLRMRNRVKIVSAIIMGLAICGMHYTGMAASVFTPLCTPTFSSSISSLEPTYLSVIIAVVTFFILAIALFASSYKEALNHQQFEKARQLGMAEISASVLHNVGNVLNSVNVSAMTVAEQISESKLIGLEKLSVLFKENEHDITTFITQDRGKKALAFLEKLADYWRHEQHSIKNEIARLIDNIALIKTIISTQQELSKTTEFEQTISLNELLDEAILITGLNVKNSIKLKKHHTKNITMKTDKVKLLQILVNLLKNAKDAVKESSNPEKMISISTLLVNKNKIRIEIADNGIGITAKDLNKIFIYGFTTKTSGHGFGLHTSAIAASRLSGEIKAQSEGVNKGAVFTLEFIYRR
jgi:NO-binding membrane sensor protein with MHYT domain